MHWNAIQETRNKCCYIDPKVFGSRDSYEEEVMRVLKNHNVQLVLLAGYMKILGKTLLAAYKNRILNIHPALLPAFPGLHAQEQAFRYGVKVAGCTVHFVDEELDEVIIVQKCVEVKDEDTAQTLAEKILETGAQIYPEVVKLFV